MKTIPNPGVDLVQYKPDFAAFCSIGGLPFFATALIEYQPDDKLVEFISCEEWLSKLYSEPTTIEEVTVKIFYHLLEVLGDIPLRVSVSARTTIHAPVTTKIERGEWK